MHDKDGLRLPFIDQEAEELLGEVADDEMWDPAEAFESVNANKLAAFYV